MHYPKKLDKYFDLKEMQYLLGYTFTRKSRLLMKGWKSFQSQKIYIYIYISNRKGPSTDPGEHHSLLVTSWI